jgi:Helix-turn-helix domain
MSQLPGKLPDAMRHTTFRFALDPAPAQAALLTRHAGASRFAYNQCLRLVTDALATKRADPQVRVPWSGFDLINAFNAWKRSEHAGRVFAVGTDGATTKLVTGLAWRGEVTAQVFEEAAIDLGRALAAYAETQNGSRKGRPVGFPRHKRKGRCRDSFRLRNKTDRRTGQTSLRVGDGNPRSVTLPRIGTVRVHDDTRRLRRLLRPVEHVDPKTGERSVAAAAKVLFARSAGMGIAGMSVSTSRRPTCTPITDTRRAVTATTAAGSGSTEVWPRSWWRPRQMALRSAASTPLGPWSAAWWACGDSRVRCPVPSPAPATGPRPSGGFPASTLASPIPVEASSTRSPAGSSRPTTGCAWKISPSPTSSATSA